ERSITWIKQTLTGTGARTRLGLELYPAFVEAGLPAPLKRSDAFIGGGPQGSANENVAGVGPSLFAGREKHKIARAAEVDISTLAQRMRDEVVALKGVVVSAGFIGAWSRKQRSD